jgi:hypothetical protein
MTAEQDAALLAYLKTLTDTKTPKAPKTIQVKNWQYRLS